MNTFLLSPQKQTIDISNLWSNFPTACPGLLWLVWMQKNLGKRAGVLGYILCKDGSCQNCDSTLKMDKVGSSYWMEAGAPRLTWISRYLTTPPIFTDLP